MHMRNHHLENPVSDFGSRETPRFIVVQSLVENNPVYFITLSATYILP